MTKKFILDQEDGTVAGGNKRGDGAVDLQMSRTSADQVAASPNSVISGGSNNRIRATTNTTSVIGGGDSNLISVSGSGTNNTIGGGYSNSITGANSNWNIISGGATNSISAITYATISGGQSNTASTNSHATVVGGQSNVSSGQYSISGGSDNVASGQGTVAFGRLNTSSSNNSTTSGGQSNTNQSTFGTISGGQYNTTSFLHATVVGGQSNTSSGRHSVSGGYSNVASGIGSVALGYDNTASGEYSVAGGVCSCATACGATAFGVTSIATGKGNFAAGTTARAQGSCESYAFGDQVNNSAKRSFIFGSESSFGTNAYCSVSMGRRHFSNYPTTFSTAGTNTCAVNPGQVTFGSHLEGDAFAPKNAGDLQHSIVVSGIDQDLLSGGATNLQNPITLQGTNKMMNVFIQWVATITTISGTADGVTIGDAITSTSSISVKKIGGVASLFGSDIALATQSDTSMSSTSMSHSIDGSNRIISTIVAPTFTGGGTITLRVAMTYHMTEV